MAIYSHLCPEMHLTLNLGTSYKTSFLSLSYDFMFDRIMCVLVGIKVRGHLAMFMNLISVHFWTYLSILQLLPSFYILCLENGTWQMMLFNLNQHD